MSDSASHAVFLSYAREDTDAARRIADALRGFGVEVWFDQSELRGGDAWDEKIRGQIRACTLFMPIISAHTQARREGYFRREWKLAVERTNDMAEGVPFLAPVVVDDTAESRALVPEQFMRVQWTRLPGGLPTPQFIEQIKRLLAQTSEPVAAREADRPRSTRRDESVVAPVQPRGSWWAGVATVVALAIGAFFYTRKSETPAAPPKPVAETKSAAPALPTDKSIAVLPFDNMSEDKDANAFFADGIHETILTNLARIRELRVVSRTSVMEYRATKENLRVIAQKLNVAYILEGSVQRSGKKVRVTGQLIRAATDEHLWADDYTKDLTAGDIFDIESELAQKIAASLQATLSPQEKKLLDQRPTENLAAYDLYLKARDVHHGSDGGNARAQQEESLLQAAVTLDPNFASAWADLAAAHAQTYFNGERSAARLAKAKAAMDTATRLAPEDPAVIRSLGDYSRMVHRDLAGANAQYEKLARLQPNNPEVYANFGFVLRRQGRWVESIEQFHRALQMDPRYADVQRNLVTTLKIGRRYDEAVTEERRLLELRPNDLLAQLQLAWFSFLARGSTKEIDTLLAGLPEKDLNSAAIIPQRQLWAVVRGDGAEFNRLDSIQPAGAVDFAVMLAAQGNLPAARSRLEESRSQLRSRLTGEPENEGLWASLGRVEAMLGHKEEALTCAQKAVDLVPESLDAFDGPGLSVLQAFVYIFTGDKDRAIAEYARLLHTPTLAGALITPTAPNVHVMRQSPVFAPLRGDPKFEALLADPKNNAPLF